MTLRGWWIWLLNSLPLGVGRSYGDKLLWEWQAMAYTSIIASRCFKEVRTVTAEVDNVGNIVFDDGKVISWQWVFLLAMGEPVTLDDML